MDPSKYTTSNSTRGRRAAPAAWLLAAAAGAALLSVTPSGASAASADDPPAVAVSYGDLNIDTERGARILLERIQAAARGVCPAADGRNLSAWATSRHCIREAVARAVRQVGSPLLAALYSGRTTHG